MSGIAGIYSLDGRPADLTVLERMTGSLAHRGTDGQGHWVDGAVGLGYRAFWTTPEAIHERQPLIDETGCLCLTMDGRVDNRDELASSLKSRGFLLRDCTDAELVLKSYACWGEECPEKILGDFAFVIWDKRQQQLLCARDIVGIRPFYYYSDHLRFLWASEVQALFAVPGIPCEPNEGMIGEYLANAVTSTEETLYAGILRLPAAHIIKVRIGRTSKKRYWDIDPSRSVRHGSDADYAGHFRQLFAEAVRCRLRTNGPVGVELSGGLDSSSVVGMTCSLLSDERSSVAGLETFSLIFPGLVFDESSYIQDVVNKWGLASNTISPECLVRSAEDRPRSRYDLPSHPQQNNYSPLLLLAGHKGIRVLLTGLGGDEWLWGSALHCADLLGKFRIADCLNELRYRSDNGITLSAFLRYAAFPLLPQPIRSATRSFRNLVRNTTSQWIVPQFAARIKLPERTRAKLPASRFRTHAQRCMHEWLTGGWIAENLERADIGNARFSIEYRAPFHDRRVIEFAFAVPEAQLWRREQYKFILRNAMEGLLPERVRERITKACYDQVVARALEAEGGERLFRSSVISSLGWVKEGVLLKMYAQFKNAHSRNEEWLPHIWPLWQAFAVNSWFRTVFPS